MNDDDTSRRFRDSSDGNRSRALDADRDSDGEADTVATEVGDPRCAAATRRWQRDRALLHCAPYGAGSGGTMDRARHARWSVVLAGVAVAALLVPGVGAAAPASRRPRCSRSRRGRAAPRTRRSPGSPVPTQPTAWRWGRPPRPPRRRRGRGRLGHPAAGPADRRCELPVARLGQLSGGRPVPGGRRGDVHLGWRGDLEALHRRRELRYVGRANRCRSESRRRVGVRRCVLQLRGGLHRGRLGLGGRVVERRLRGHRVRWGLAVVGVARRHALWRTAMRNRRPSAARRPDASSSVTYQGPVVDELSAVGRLRADREQAARGVVCACSPGDSTSSPS